VNAEGRSVFDTALGLNDRLPETATGPWLAAAVVALGSWHSWRLDLTEPRGLTDTTTSNSRPNSPTIGAIGSFCR
jgi:hypothetical protein